MNAMLRITLVAGGMAIATHAAAQVTFYERDDFEGRTFSTDKQISDFQRTGFNDRASSVVVLGTRWEVCEDAQFGGHCVVLRPRRYSSLASMGLNDRVSSLRAVGGNSRIDDHRYAPAPLAAEVTFYARERFEGQSFTAERQIRNFERVGFNDRASSVVVLGGPWEVCEHPQFAGRCTVLRPGRYPSLGAMGLNDRVSSVRAVSGNARINDNRYAPAPVAAYDYRRRNHERLYEANVTSVQAVVGPPEQRCWVEREQAAPNRSGANVPGAIAGAIIGGILGHQVGGGRGQDIATAGGASQGQGSGGCQYRSRSRRTAGVRPGRPALRNRTEPSRPEYWNVTYNFRGQEHRIQMSAPPGPTVTVNEQGEPRA